MNKQILVRYGDLTLKGHNKKKFIDAAIARIKERLGDCATYTPHHDRLYLGVDLASLDDVIASLQTVPGLRSFSPIDSVDKTLEAIKAMALTHAVLLNANTTFRVKVKRADKRFEHSSMAMEKSIGAHILSNTTKLSVDVHHPHTTINVEVRRDGAFVYSKVIQGLQGFPVGSMGEGIALLSGGIDSPVAAFLAMKKGINVHLVHFESTPLTSIESAQKAVDLSKVLAHYAKGRTIRLHMVPFLNVHRAILDKVPEHYHITIMRRMMVRIAERYAENDHIPVLINGESIGQVASQTLESMKTTQMVGELPIIRPLAVMEKNTVSDIARSIGTYPISVRPFEDCCAVYVPTQPVTKPRDYYARRYESLFDSETLVNEATQAIHTMHITPETSLDLPNRGFTLTEALEGYDD